MHIREGVKGKKTFSFGHCPNDGEGGGSTHGHAHMEWEDDIKSLTRLRRKVDIRVSQKIQKSESWNATYPSGFIG